MGRVLESDHVSRSKESPDAAIKADVISHVKECHFCLFKAAFRHKLASKPKITITA